MSEEKSKDSKSKSDDFPIYFLVIWMPMMFVMFTLVTDNEHEHLTEEQILQRQVEAEEKKLQKDKEWQESVDAFDEQVDIIMKDAPFPFNIIVGLAVLAIVFKGFNSAHVRRLRRLRNLDLLEYMNPNILVPVMVGFLYVMWLSGDLDMIGLVKYDE